MNNATSSDFSMNKRSRIVEPTAWLAIVSTTAAVLLLIVLHVLSPEFSPAWRMVSEYAFGDYAWVLSLMFLTWGIGTWALSVAIWDQVQTRAGRVGLYFLIVAGIGEALASVFDIKHEIGHGIAGLLGVIGFPIAAFLLSVALGHNETWSALRKALVWIANLSWISIVLLAATMAIMMMQLSRANGGHLPQHAPKSLPPGVLALDGWADRLIVLSNCAWVLLVACRAIQMCRRYSKAVNHASGHYRSELASAVGSDLKFESTNHQNLGEQL
ncbi:MAG TPA: DUF998 domain-containing protein [Bryobacteraceae bacterium]|jgi:hypothetical protein|nr:DUF998 domain-containing protein [Bryobacteraceae bacterium]